MPGISEIAPAGKYFNSGNNLLKADILQRNLDLPLMQSMTTSWMDANASQVIYNGGREVKIATISTDGMKDYDRKNGYLSGSVSMGYQTYVMTQDRGMKFRLDSMDIDEANFIPNAARVIGECQRTKVAPEIDAYRYSKIYGLIKSKFDVTSGSTTTNAYVKDENDTGVNVLTAGNVYTELITTIHEIEDQVGEQNFVITVPYGVYNLLATSTEFQKNVSVETFHGVVDTRVKVVEGCPILVAPSRSLQTDFTFHKGSETSGLTSGFEKGAAAKPIQWIICPRTAPIAITKTEKLKIISPEINQQADAWDIAYRRFHDLWITDEMAKAFRIRLGKTA